MRFIHLKELISYLSSFFRNHFSKSTSYTKQLQTFPGPIRRCTVKPNHLGLVAIEFQRLLKVDLMYNYLMTINLTPCKYNYLFTCLSIYIYVYLGQPGKPVVISTGHSYSSSEYTLIWTVWTPSNLPIMNQSILYRLRNKVYLHLYIK